MNALKETIDLDQFVIDLHFFFKRSAARREDLAAVSAVTDVTVHYLLRHCESRWLGIEKVLVRVIEQLPNIRQYFLKDLPQRPEFKGEKGVGKTKRYLRIAENLSNPALEALMAFVVFIGQDYKKYIIPLQTNAPMIHVLHGMQIKLVYALMSKFIQSKFILDDSKNKTKAAKDLLEIDVTNSKLQLAKIQIGSKATYCLKKLDGLQQKKIIAVMTGFLEACTSYLLTNLPLNDPVLKKSKSLHPDHRLHKDSLNNISFLAQTVCKALGDKAMKETFHLTATQTKFDLLDIIRNEYQVYQMESIPESMYLVSVPKKKSSSQRDSYWRRAYEIAGILEEEDDDNDNDKKVAKRIDDYWVEVCGIRDETGKKKYSNLWILVKCIMLISHGNADPERGFSINKHMLAIHGTSLGEQTIVAIRLIKDYVVQCGGIGKVPLSDKLLQSCKLARSRYGADLEEKRKLAEKEEKARLAAKAAMEAAEAAKEAKKKNEEARKKVQNEINIVEAGLKVAEDASEEGIKEMKNLLVNNASLSKKELLEKMTLAEAKIDGANKRKKELSEEVSVLKKKKKNIGS